MNRREALQAGLAVLSAVGIDGEVATVAPKNPQMVVLSTKFVLSKRAKENLSHAWRGAVKGTSLEGVKAIILEEGMTLQVIDDNGSDK